MKYRHKINSEISITYIVTKKKLTMVAALGVTGASGEVIVRSPRKPKAGCAGSGPGTEGG